MTVIFTRHRVGKKQKYSMGHIRCETYTMIYIFPSSRHIGNIHEKRSPMNRKEWARLTSLTARGLTSQQEYE